MSLNVVYEDNHLLVVNKGAGLATMGAKAGHESLVDRAKRYLKAKYQKPGNVYLGVVSRLDAPVTGLIVFARTSKSAARLTAAFRDREVRKLYWAVVSPARLAPSGRLSHWVRKDEAQRRMVTVPPNTASSRLAELDYRRLADQTGQALLEIDLLTGRKHQIRVQLASSGCPIVGDGRYGSRVVFPHGIGLHARQLEFIHPVTKQPLRFVVPPPRYWPNAFRGQTR